MATVKLTVKWTAGRHAGKTTTRKLDVACAVSAVDLYEVGSSWSGNHGTFVVVRVAVL